MNILDLKTKTFEGLELNSYVPLVMKQLIIDGDDEGNEGLASECIVVKDNGMKAIDIFAKEALISITLVREYTNIDLSSEELEGYELIDIIIESGLVGTIVKEVPDAKRFITMLEDKIKQELEGANTLPAVVANNLAKLVDKIPDDINAKWFEKMLKNLPKMINAIEPERMEVLKGALGQKKE